MPRQPKLSQKNGYWYTKAGNPNGEYFGKVGDVTYQEARKRFAQYIKSLGERRHRNSSSLTTLELCDSFLDWVKQHRSERTYDERRRHLDRFNNFHAGSQLIADIPATDIQAADLTAFMMHLAEEKQRDERKRDDFTIDKHATSVKAAFNWGIKHPSPTPHLPSGFRPFASIEKYKRPLKTMLEGDLLSPDEIAALFKFADADLAAVSKNGKFQRRDPHDYRPDHLNPYVGFEDVLRLYWHTGARTSELAHCLVKDFVKPAKQIILGGHKRSKTMKEPVVRRITLNPDALAIIKKRCDGKRPDEHIFTDPKGRPWTRNELDRRFSVIRDRAGLRDDITIYSFRHLWISEMLMAKNDVATVAKMAGTSIAMIERVYGHFTNDHFSEAQSRLDELRKKQDAT